MEKNDSLIQRLDFLIEKTGVNATAASLRAGLAKDYIRNIQRGKALNPSGEKLQRLAELGFGANFMWLLTGAGEPFPEPVTGMNEEVSPIANPWRRIIVSGTVQAGYWAEPNEEQTGEPEVLHIPLPEVLRSVPVQGIRVEGDSMNRVFPAGTRLVCASLYDLHEDEPIAGKRYIVRRTRADGAVEMTVKEAEQDATGKWWLWPRSTDPRHQEPIPFDTKEGDSIEVTARVLYSVRPE